MTDRTYLAVPFSERDRAKRAGARWDAERRAWYTHEVTGALRCWLPQPVTPLQLQVDPRSEMAAVMQQVGLQVQGPHPIMDGHGRNVRLQGAKRGKAGFYVLHDGPVPWGYALNWRTGESSSWNAARDHQLSEQDRASLRAQAAEESARYERERARTHEDVAQRTARLLQRLTPLQEGAQTEYLRSKGVLATRGLYSSPNHQWTYVPMQDIAGRLWGLQTINPSGDKRFAKGGRIDGCFHVLGGSRALRAADPAGSFVIAEGYATAVTVHGILAPGDPTVTTLAAFNAGNLKPVALAVRQRFPGASIVIAGDDDYARSLDPKVRVNPGKVKATEAAQAVDGLAILPPFTTEHPVELSDWNDLDQHKLAGYDPERHRAILRDLVHGRAHAPTSYPVRDMRELLRREFRAIADEWRARREAPTCAPQRNTQVRHREHVTPPIPQRSQVRDLDEDHELSR